MRMQIFNKFSTINIGKPAHWTIGRPEHVSRAETRSEVKYKQVVFIKVVKSILVRIIS